MTQRVVVLLAVAAGLLGAAPASAWWSVAGSGTGSVAVATVPAGETPSTAVAGRAVTVTWAQVTFLGSRLGTRTGGGYRVVRYASGSAVPVTPGAGCAGVVAGTAASLSCTETGVPPGRWTYAVIPVLQSFTGSESPVSALTTVAPDAPAGVTATALDPATGSDVGAVRIDWSAVPGASGYDVHRRVSGGAFGTPVNGATPVTATTLSDAGVAAGTTYEYLVRAIGGGVESAASAVVTATPVVRPAAPAAVTAQAISGARVAVAWTAPAGVVAGYDVYRRLAGGSLGTTPLNGATLVTGTTFTDLGAADGSSYRYVVRAVVQGSARVESAASAESATVTADGTPPAVPTAVAPTTGTTALAGATCGFAAGTRFLNGTADATRNAAGATFGVTLAGVQAGDTVTVTATTGTMVATTVAATGTTLGIPLPVTTLADGTVTVTAVARDAVGNVSAARTATVPLVKDTVATVGTITYEDVAVFGDRLGVPTECGTAITATRTAPAAAGPFTTTATANAPTATSLTVAVGGILGQTNVYAVGLTDLAGNTFATTAQGVSLL